MLCGRCLVASTELIRKLPNHAQLPSGYGCVAVEDVNDIDALAERLTAIAQDPEPAAAVGRRAREFALEIEQNIDFPQTLERILATATARGTVSNFLADADDDADAIDFDDQFYLTQLVAAALPQHVPEDAKEASIGLDVAQQILVTLEHAIAAGQTRLRPLATAVEIEIAVANAENALGDAADTDESDPLFRLHTQRWAVGEDDCAKLAPVRDSGLKIVEFNFDVAPYLAAPTIEDFPRSPPQRQSHIVVFARRNGKRRDPLLVDQATALILQLSDGRRTTLQIAQLANPGGRKSAIEQSQAWIVALFRRGLIGWRDPPSTRAAIQPLAKAKSRG
jgi:hypothetical protein